jgi:hypothetical protein
MPTATKSTPKATSTGAMVAPVGGSVPGGTGSITHGKSGGAVVDGGRIAAVLGNVGNVELTGTEVVVAAVVVGAGAVVVVVVVAAVVVGAVVVELVVVGSSVVVVDAVVVVACAVVVDNASVVVVVLVAAVVEGVVVVDDGGGSMTVMTFESVKPSFGCRMSIFHWPGGMALLTSRQNSPASSVVNSYGPNVSWVDCRVTNSCIGSFGG